MPRSVPVAGIFDRAAERHRISNLAALEFPWVARGQPVVRQFLLHAVGDPLPEQAIAIADAVADRRNAQRRHAVHETSREPPQPAIAEPGVGFGLAHLLEIDAQVPQRLLHRLDHGEVAERVEQQAADQVLDRKVIDALAARRGLLRGGENPAVDDAIAYGERRRQKPVVTGCVVLGLAKRVDELGQDGVPPRRYVRPRGGDLRGLSVRHVDDPPGAPSGYCGFGIFTFRPGGKMPDINLHSLPMFSLTIGTVRAPSNPCGCRNRPKPRAQARFPPGQTI